MVMYNYALSVGFWSRCLWSVTLVCGLGVSSTDLGLGLAKVVLLTSLHVCFIRRPDSISSAVRSDRRVAVSYGGLHAMQLSVIHLYAAYSTHLLPVTRRPAVQALQPFV